MNNVYPTKKMEQVDNSFKWITVYSVKTKKDECSRKTAGILPCAANWFLGAASCFLVGKSFFQFFTSFLHMNIFATHWPDSLPLRAIFTNTLLTEMHEEIMLFIDLSINTAGLLGEGLTKHAIQFPSWTPRACATDPSIYPIYISLWIICFSHQTRIT